MRQKPNWALTGKVIIVTGASAGIGEAAARAFGRAGAKVVLAARRAERLERLAAEIRAEGGTALPIPTDVTNTNQIENLVRATLEAYGRIDVLANIAGWGRYDWLEELSAENLRMQYEVNVIGMAEMIRQVLPVMKAQRAGHILNMSSYASEIATPPLTVYASTKYAVEGLSDGLRRELLPWGISCHPHPPQRGDRDRVQCEGQAGRRDHVPLVPGGQDHPGEAGGGAGEAGGKAAGRLCSSAGCMMRRWC